MASFAYDAAGRRVARTAGGVTTSFLYDGDSVLLEQQGGATTATYAYGNALTRKDGETPLFDGQGSERTVTNTAGAVQASLTLSAFGQTLASSGGSTSAYQYAATSRYRSDGDAGLSLVGCRYYDAQVGAFITRDTYLDQKPYAYCDGNPVNATDPSGHGPFLRGLLRQAEGVDWSPGGITLVTGLAIFGAVSSVDFIVNPPPDTFHRVLGTIGGAGTVAGGIGFGEVGIGLASGAAVTEVSVLAGATVLTGGVVIVAIGVVAIGVGLYKLTH